MPLYHRDPKGSFGAEGYDNYYRIFARAEDVSNENLIWDGATIGSPEYDGWLDNEEDIEWSSTSEQDAPGGTGAQAIFIKGQGDDGKEKTFQGALNGANWIKISDDTVDPEVRFNVVINAWASNVEGSNLLPMISQGCGNAGTITIRSVTTQKILAVILPNLGETQMAIFRCPMDHYARFSHLSIYHTANQSAVIRIMYRENKTMSWRCVGNVDIEQDIADIDGELPTYLNPGSDFCMIVDAGLTATDISVQVWFEKIPIKDYDDMKARGEVY